MKEILSTVSRMLGMLIFFTGCSRDGSASENPPVGVVSTSTHRFTLHAGPNGTLYTIHDRDGKEVAREISGQYLAAEFPELSAELRGLWAGNERVNTKDLILKDSSIFEPVDKPARLFERIAIPSSTFETPGRSTVPAR